MRLKTVDSIVSTLETGSEAVSGLLDDRVDTIHQLWAYAPDIVFLDLVRRMHYDEDPDGTPVAVLPREAVYEVGAELLENQDRIEEQRLTLRARAPALNAHTPIGFTFGYDRVPADAFESLDDIEEYRETSANRVSRGVAWLMGWEDAYDDGRDARLLEEAASYEADALYDALRDYRLEVRDDTDDPYLLSKLDYALSLNGELDYDLLELRL